MALLLLTSSVFIALVIGSIYWTQTSRSFDRRVKKFITAQTRQRDIGAGELQLKRGKSSAIDAALTHLLPRSEKIRARLEASGTGWTLSRYGLISCGVTLFTATLFARFMGVVVAMLVAVLIGIWVPYALLGSLTKRRQNRFVRLFPEAISLMIRGLQAGLPISETMLVVGREVADPVGEEFRQVADQVKLGQRLEDALWLVAKRLSMPDFNFLVITLSIQKETGGNLGETLTNLEMILRRRQQMKLKIRAMSSEAVASAGIIGSLPFIMTALLFVVSPKYIATLFTTGLGLLMFSGAALSLGLGVFVMMRMVRFEV